MNLRLCVRLAAVSLVATGVVGLAGHLAHQDHVDRSQAGPGSSSLRAVSESVGPLVAGAATSADVRTVLQRSLRSAPQQAGQPVGRRDATGASLSAVVDESKPHTHVVDPDTGGLISVARAKGVVGDVSELGPMHADPMPAGVLVSDPIDTRTLLDRAGGVADARASSDGAFTAGSTAPVGTPGIRTLSAHVATSCPGTGTDGNRVQVLFVHEGTASRYAQVLPVLRNEVANVDDVFALSAQQTGGERRVRWVHGADCLPVIKDVTVPKGALGPDFWGTISALKKLGYQDPHRKYLMFADASRFCGIGTMYDDARQTGNANDGSNASYARVDAGCWSSSHSVAAHELTHTLGGVLQSAPHATKYGHCFDESDLMCYADGVGSTMQKICADAQEQLLDCRHDDYFSTKPASGSFLAKNWNTARSSFLDTVVTPVPPPDATLRASASTARTGDRVTFTGTSSRTVSWTWATSVAACALTPGTSGRADLVCPATARGAVAVTATATEAGTAATSSRTATVTMTKAVAPTARLTAPTSADVGRPFTVAVTALGSAPFGYRWTADGCVVRAPLSVSTTVTCASSSQAAVAVLVTQADGQQVRATAPVTLSGGVVAQPAVSPERTPPVEAAPSDDPGTLGK